MTQTKLSLEQRLERVEKLFGIENLDELDLDQLRLQVKLQLLPEKDCKITKLSFMGRPYTKCL
jgi:hypothetical protein